MIDMSKLTEKEKAVVEKAKLISLKVEEVLEGERKLKDPVGVFIIRFDRERVSVSTVGFIQLSSFIDVLARALQYYGVRVIPIDISGKVVGS